MRDGQFSSDIGIANLHPFRCTHWVLYINENYFDPHGSAPPQKLSKINIKRKGHCLYSEYKIQDLTNNKDYFCASFYLYTLYLLKVECLVSKSAVLNSFYQRIQKR